jgi:hypothetical protein
MKQVTMFLLLLGFIAIAFAGDGYVVTGSQGIMHFVQVDKDRATDLPTYLRAKDEICKSHGHCQVLFWTENAPRMMPFTREQTRQRRAYWQYDKKSGSHHLYVDCEFFGTDHDATCF